MSTPDPMLAEIIRDNAQDDERAREAIAVAERGNSVALAVAQQNREAADRRIERLVAAMTHQSEQVKALGSRRAEALMILASMAASTTKAKRRQALIDCREILDELYPEG